MANNHVYGSLNHGIGDYIHYHLENYRNYGINRWQEGPSISAEKALSNSHQKVKSLIKQRDRNIQANTVMDYLNDFFYRIPEITSMPSWHSDWTTTDYLKEQQKLEENVKNKFPLLVANMQNLSFLSNLDNIDALANSGLKKYTGAQGGRKTQHMKQQTLERIQNHIFQLQTIIANIGKNINLEVGDLNLLDKWFNQCGALADKIEAEVLNNPELAIREKTNDNAQFTYTKLGNLMREFNKLIKNVLKPTNEQYGEIGEIGMAYALNVAGTVGQRATGEVVNQTMKSIVGKEGQQTHYNRFGQMIRVDTVVSDMNTYDYKTKSGKIKTTQGKFYQYDDVGNAWSVNPSQDTVDISVELAPTSYLGKQLGINKLNASIKNVSNMTSKDGIHILNGAPLMAVLELASTDFVNHYLNMLACTASSLKDYGGQNSSMGDIQYYENEILYLTAVRGLSGLRSVDNPSLTTHSDCFIVNDRSRKHVYVWGTGDLLSQIESLKTNIEQAIKLNSGNLPTFLKNDFIFWHGDNELYSYGAAYYRASKVVAQLQKYKIYASLQVSKIPNNYLNK